MPKNSNAIVTQEVIAVAGYPRDVLIVCVDWFNKTMARMSCDKIGIRFSLNENPKGVEGQQPHFAIEVTALKQYLGVESMRNWEHRADVFMQGVIAGRAGREER